MKRCPMYNSAKEVHLIAPSVNPELNCLLKRMKKIMIGSMWNMGHRNAF